jgi:hypothetical protein
VRTNWSTVRCTNPRSWSVIGPATNAAGPGSTSASRRRTSTAWLLATVADNGVRRGAWQLLEPGGWPDNQSCRTVLAWCWRPDDGADRHLVVINFSDHPAQARIPLGWPDLPGHRWRLADLLGDDVFERDGDDLADSGMYADLAPWQAYLLAPHRLGT